MGKNGIEIINHLPDIPNVLYRGAVSEARCNIDQL